ncbi:hypothetical protein SLS62_009676 [Diatrype stigma]|uniref:Uncharacterized protein n=1 Tax=Diatrype stigma TaxID=117547 RepID=A0AAN9UCP3_9PEZI
MLRMDPTKANCPTTEPLLALITQGITCTSIIDANFPPLPNNMPRVSLVKGYQISVVKLDDFLESNGINGTEGGRIWPDEMKQISELFRSKGVDCDTRIFKAERTGFLHPHHMFVCYDWVDVFAAKRVDGCLTKPVPKGFDEMRQSLGVEADIGTFLVFDEEVDWIPEALMLTDEVSIVDFDLSAEP